MAIYDSEKTRETARDIVHLIDVLNMDVQPNLKKALEFEDDIDGAAARAMICSLQRINRCISHLKSDLETVQHQLNLYADQMEEADEQLAQSM